MAKKWRCHRRTQTPDMEGKTGEEKTRILIDAQNKQCASCDVIDNCGYMKRVRVKKIMRLDKLERRGKNVHLCFPRVEQKDIDFKCEQCALARKYRKNFKSCGHKTLFKTQSTLDDKPKHEDLKIDEEVK